MAHEHKHADAVIAIGVRRLTDREEVAEGLGHLLVVNVDKAVVQPVVDELAAVRRLGLGDLILVVREGEVAAAAVNIDGFAEIAIGHGGALDVPAGSALSPRGIPVGLAGLGGLPESEVERVFLDIVDVDARAGLQIVDRLVAQLAVVLELERAVIHVAVHLVGIALLDEDGDDVDDLLNVLGRLRMHGGRLDAERLRIDEIFVDILLRDLIGGDALLVRALDDLVVDVGEVLHEGDVVASVLEIAAENVEHDDRAGVADVDVVIHRRAAGVHADLALLDGDELFLLHGHGIIELHGKSSSLKYKNKSLPCARHERRMIIAVPLSFFTRGRR